MVLYVSALLVQLRWGDTNTRLGWARWAWTVGFGLCLVHVLCAFAFYHHWSHAEAVEDTARQTRQLLGLEFGQGVYANYAFLLVWALDVVWWWTELDRYRNRPRWVRICILGFLSFIAFNATVVFVTGTVRWIGIAMTILLGFVWWRCRREGTRALGDRK